ncbi:MAG: hypothetical protein ABI311_01425 [Gemmatimonadaceae bacterium]
MFNSKPSRRTFVTHLAALVGASVMLPDTSRAGSLSAGATAPGDEPEPWLLALTGKHRTLFHSHDKWSKGLDYATRFKLAYPVEYGVKPEDANSVLAAHGKTGLITYNDAAWDKYGFAKEFDVTDPATKKQATRNIFINGDKDNPGVREAFAAGVVILSCRTMLRGMAEGLADQKKWGDAKQIERDLTASLLPGVILVPAMMIAIGRAQEHGCTYLFTG